MQDLTELLRSNPYPGRGIVVGKDVVYYWIMGRSSNSRNRVFVSTEDGIRTEAHDPALLEDPSLIIYHPVRTMGGKLVVTNGDQTDTIVNAGSFRDGCMAREFEPDAPNFTPRISAVINEDGTFEISILKHQDNGRCQRNFFAYEGADEGDVPVDAEPVADATAEPVPTEPQGVPNFDDEPQVAIDTEGAVAENHEASAAVFGGAATVPAGPAHEGGLPLVDGAGEDPGATVAMPAMPQE